MAFTLVDTVATVQGTGASNPIVSPTRDWTGAHLVVAFVGCYVAPIDATFLTDPGGNTWTKVASQGGFADASLIGTWFYKISPTITGSDAITFTPAGGAGGYPSMAVYAFSCGGAPTFGTSVGGGSSLTSVQPGSIGNSGELVLEGIAFYDHVSNTGLPSIDSGFATPAGELYIANSIGSAVSWLEVGGSVNPTWTFGNAHEQAAKAISFAPSAGGESPSVSPSVSPSASQSPSSSISKSPSPSSSVSLSVSPSASVSPSSSVSRSPSASSGGTVGDVFRSRVISTGRE